VVHALDEALGTDEVKRCRPPQREPKQAVKSREMIHMGVGHENVADPEDFAGRKPMDIAEVEQDCPTPEAKIDQEPRIGEDVIDEPRLDEPRHGRSLSGHVADLCAQRKACSWSGKMAFWCND